MILGTRLRLASAVLTLLLGSLSQSSAASNETSSTIFPKYYFFAVQEDVARALNSELKTLGYTANQVSSGIYFQDQLSPAITRMSKKLMNVLDIETSFDDGKLQIRFGTPTQPVSLPYVSSLGGLGRFHISVQNEEIGNSNATLWLVSHQGKLKFPLKLENRIWTGMPRSRFSQTVQGGMMISEAESGLLRFIPNHSSLKSFQFPVVPVSEIVLSDISGMGFYFAGQSPGSSDVVLYYGNTLGDLVPLQSLSISPNEIPTSLVIVPQGGYLLKQGRLSFIQYDAREKKTRVLFERQSGGGKEFVIFRNAVFARNKSPDGQIVSFYITPQGDEIEAKGENKRPALNETDHQKILELQPTYWTQKAAQGEFFHILPRPRYVQSILTSIAYGTSGWINLVGKKGVNAIDVAKDLSNWVTWNNEALPEKWRDLTIISISFEQLKQLYDAGLAIEAAKKSGGPAASSQNPWNVFMQSITSKQVLLLFPDFLQTQGVIGPDQQLSFLLNVFNNRINSKDLGDLESRRIMVMTVSEQQNWDQAVHSAPHVSDLAQTIVVHPPNHDELKAVVNYNLPSIESSRNVLFDQKVIQKVSEYSSMHSPNLEEPKRSLDLMGDLASFARERAGLSQQNQSALVDLSIFDQFMNESHGFSVQVPLREKFLNDIRLKIVGQNLAIEKITGAVSRIRSGLYPKDKGYGMYLLIGPHGVGKTETAKALRDVLGFPMVTVNLASNPGSLISSDARKQLAQLNNVPHIVLFDEIDKADTNVIRQLHPILENGVYEDGEGNSPNAPAVSFKNALVLLTANYGAQEIKKTYQTLGEVTAENEAAYINALETSGLVQNNDAAAQIGQIPYFIWVRLVNNVCIYTGFNREEGIEILKRQLDALQKRLKQEWGRNFSIHLSMDFALQKVDEAVVSGKFGHALKQVMESYVVSSISNYLERFQAEEIANLSDIYILSTPSGKTMVVSNFDEEAIREQLKSKSWLTPEISGGGVK